MKIVYDQVSSDYLYPLSKRDIRVIVDFIPHDVRENIRLINFGCNTKTTQEAKLTQRGNIYDVRVNFCLNKYRSLILSDDKKYLEQVRTFGGKINFSDRYVTWDLSDAKRYACFLIMHEIGHILYCRHHMDGELIKKGTSKEEEWCDAYAINCLNELKI